MLRSLITVLAVALLATPAFDARAQDIPLWGHKIIGQIYAAQFNNGCFATPPETPSIYLLGVLAGDDTLEEKARVELVSRVETILSAQGNFRFRSAGAFQQIATSSTSFSDARVQELSKLVESASDADVTILLSPFSKRGQKVDIRVMFWARDGKGADRKLTCTPAVTIAYEAGTEDAACTRAWEQAERANTLYKYMGFLDYLGHCPEAELAQKKIDELRAGEEAARQRAACEKNPK